MNVNSNRTGEKTSPFIETLNKSVGWGSFGIGLIATAGFAKYGIDVSSQEPALAFHEHAQNVKVVGSVLGGAAGLVVATAGVVLASIRPEN